MAAPVVGVVGLSALTRDLKKAGDPNFGAVVKEMQKAGRAAAAPIADVARSAVPHDTDRLAGDIRVTASRTGAAVRMGRKNKVNYAGWVEFGGTRRKPHESTREFVKSGRYLFPAAQGRAGETADLYSDAINKAFADFAWTNSGDNPESAHD